MHSEVHQAIKTVAEGVMESLRMLLVILMHCLESPLTEEVHSADLNCINRLVSEVQSQKQHIEALARMLQQPRPNSMGNSYPGGRGGSTERYLLSPTSVEIIEEDEWETELIERSIEEFNQVESRRNIPSRAATAAVVPTPKSPPRSHNNCWKSSNSTNAIDTNGGSWKYWRPFSWGHGRESPTDHVSQFNNRIMGAKASVMGTQTSTGQVCGRFRVGSGLRDLAKSPGKDPYNSNDRFPVILPHEGSHGSQSPRDSDPGINHETPNQKWEPIIEHGQEALWVKEIKEWNTGEYKIDLLEVYASPNSRLVEAVRQKGGKAERFTIEHGDLSTDAGRKELLRTIDRLKPRHLWMAPECLPWCAWNRFNQYRSQQGFERVQNLQEESRKQLRFCSLLCKLQVHHGRHFHVENPDQSGMWQQEAMKFVVMHSRAIRFDQCRYGLRHPITQLLMKKATRVQTTSEKVVRQMDGRFCDRKHEHSPIAGSFRTGAGSVQVSRFSAFYPVILARSIAKALMEEHDQPVVSWEKVCVGEEEDRDLDDRVKRRKMTEVRTGGDNSQQRKREADEKPETTEAKRSRSEPVNYPENARPCQC